MASRLDRYRPLGVQPTRTVAPVLQTGGPTRSPVVVAIGHGVFDNMEVVARYAERAAGDTSPLGIRDISSANNLMRFRGYTPPVSSAHRAPPWTGLTPDNVGALDDFPLVIESEIKPKVAALSRGMRFAFPED